MWDLWEINLRRRCFAADSGISPTQIEYGSDHSDLQWNNGVCQGRWSLIPIVTPVAAAIASDVRNNWIGWEIEFGLRKKFLP
jgi:hypothetical protein